jgi:hypothetical protein
MDYFSLALPIIRSEDFPQDVRITPDGRVSVYDGIGYLLGNKNPYQVWNDLVERIPEVLHKTENLQFPGKGQRPTPVATLEAFVEILVTLPGRIAAQVREKAVRTLIRALKGDPTLVDEILSRIQNPQDLVDLEGMIRLRRQHAYGGELPGGTLDNPLDLDQITSELEAYGYVLPDVSISTGQKITPDISIGQMFCRHMRSQGFDVDGEVQKYTHYYPDGRIVQANIYPDKWLEQFRTWFNTVWKQERLLDYLGSRDPEAQTLDGVEPSVEAVMHYGNYFTTHLPKTTPSEVGAAIRYIKDLLSE